MLKFHEKGYLVTEIIGSICLPPGQLTTSLFPQFLGLKNRKKEQKHSQVLELRGLST